MLRDDSTTAYKDNEIWAEFRAKTAGGSPISWGIATPERFCLLAQIRLPVAWGRRLDRRERNQLVRKVRRRFGVHSGGNGRHPRSDLFSLSPRQPSGLIPSSRPMATFSRISAGGAWVQGDDSSTFSRISAGGVWQQIVAAGSGNTLAPGTGHLTLSGKQPALFVRDGVSRPFVTDRYASVVRQDGHFLAPGSGHITLSGKQPPLFAKMGIS